VVAVASGKRLLIHPDEEKGIPVFDGFLIFSSVRGNGIAWPAL
jgi:hypothetical protein